MTSKRFKAQTRNPIRMGCNAILAGMMLLAGGATQLAHADYLGTKTIRMFVDPADLSVIQDGLQTADQFRLIAEVTPGDTGSNSAQSGWNTFYTVPGMLVAGVAIIDIVNGNYVKVNAKDTDAAYDGWGIRGAKNYSKTNAHLGEGRVNEVQQDSGIFYSTDPRTRYVPGTGSPPAPGTATYGTVQSTGNLKILNQPVPVHNMWDRDQVLGFGTKTAVSGNAGTGNTPLVTNNGGTTWRGTGSPVAGPHSRYTNDYNPRCGTSGNDAGVSGQAGSGQNAFAYNYTKVGSAGTRTDQSNPAPEFTSGGTFVSTGSALVDSLACIGPWRRVAYQGSKIGGSGAIAQATAQGQILNTAVPVAGGNVGDDIVNDLGGFLPVSTNAIRFVAGARRVGDIELFAVTIRITDLNTFLANIQNLCVMSLGSDTADVSAKDNNWRYYEPIFLQGSGSSQACVDLSAKGNLFKQVAYVNNTPSGGLTSQIGDILSYTVKFTNTTSGTIDGLALSDAVGPGLNISNNANLDLVASTTSGCAWAPGGAGGHVGYNATFSASGTGGTLLSPADTVAGFPVGFNGTVTWNTINGLAPGDSVTVYMCAKVVAGAQGDILENKSLASYTGCGTVPCMTSSASTAIGNLLAGTVYNDANGNGSLDMGETGIPGVSVALYLNNGGTSGQYDGSNTFVAQTTTGPDGSFNFAAIPAATYILVETDPGGYVSTGNIIHAGNPGACALQGTANSCNVIGPIVMAANSVVTGRDFYDFTAPQPVLTKGFNPTSIVVGGTSVLTFTVDNSGTGSVAQSGLFFTDLLPTSLQLANGNTTVGAGCGGPPVIKDNADQTLATGSLSVKVTGLNLAAGATCTISVNVTNKAGLINTSCPAAPTFTNSAANITAIYVNEPPLGLINGIQPSCLNVTPVPPTLTKIFGPPTSFPIGGSTTLTFTIANPAGNPALTGLGFSDDLPAGLQLLNGTVGGTCAAGYTITDDADLPALPAALTTGSTSILVSNLSVAAGASSCTIIVNVTNKPLQVNSSCNGLPPAFTNDATNITTIVGMSNGVQASCVTVTPLTPTLAKSFAPQVINSGESTTLIFTVTNPAPNIALSNVGFVDNLPAGLMIANPAQIGGTCNNNNAAPYTTAVPGQSVITVSALPVAAGQSSCTITVKVTNKPGNFNPSCNGNPANFTNGSSNVTLTNVLNGVSNQCVVVNTFTFGITKTPSVSIVTPGSPLSFTVVITNNGPSAADGAIITDPAIPFYAVSDPVVCAGTTGNASCPTPLTAAALQGAGMTVASFPAGATVTLRIDGVSSLVNGQLVNTVTVSPPAGVPGVASASASAVVATKVGVIPTLHPQLLLALMLLLAVGTAIHLRRRRS